MKGGCYKLKNKNEKDEKQIFQQLKDLVFEKNIDLAKIDNLSGIPLSENQLFWIAAIKKDDKGGIEVKFHDRTKAIELLLKLADDDKGSDKLIDLLSVIDKSVKEAGKHED